MAKPALFQRLALIGVGLIGSSIARIARREGIAAEIVGADISAKARAELNELKLCDRVLAEAGDGDVGIGDLLLTGLAEQEQLPVKTLQVHVPAPPPSGC